MSDHENDHWYLTEYDGPKRPSPLDVLRAERDNLRERLDRAKAALVSHGPFTADQVDDDIAPRIIEMVSRFDNVGANIGHYREAQRAFMVLGVDHDAVGRILSNLRKSVNDDMSKALRGNA